jgi:hypothetical protein
MARRLFALAVALGLISAAVPLACFSLKEPPCAFSCVRPPNRCPENYSCLPDGLCHREGATSVCTLTAPGGGPTGPADAGMESQANDGGEGTTDSMPGEGTLTEADDS